MLRYTLSLILLFGGFLLYTLQAQTAFDALRFSYYPQPGGSARNMGVGGALSSFGADFATLSSNPAGLASYRRSEFSFSPEIFSIKTKSLLTGNDLNEIYTEDRSSLNINNVGFVIASLPRASSWKTINFGIGLNRSATFTQSLFFSGASPGSITHRFVNKANGLETNQLDNFEEGLAYDVGAIFPDQTNPGNYLNDFGDLEEVNKSQIVNTRGAINEMVFSLAGNYEEKLQLGVTIGVPILSFSEDKTYVENDPGNKNPIFNELIFQENVRVTGTGVNLKLGMIYKPIHAIRIGAAIHTPTAFSLDDSYSTRMTYDYTFNGNNRFTESSPEGFFEYRLRTPWRVIGSTGVLFNKSGFLSAEIEWADYSSASFRFNNTTNPADKEYERELNRDIQRSYDAAFIARFGGELVFDVFRVRAGFNLINSPSARESYTRGVGTIGFGVREKGFFLDIAYRIGLVGGTYQPYQSTSELQPDVDLGTTAQNFLMTLGFRF